MVADSGLPRYRVAQSCRNDETYPGPLEKVSLEGAIYHDDAWATRNDGDVSDAGRGFLANSRAQIILFLLVDRVRGKLDCRPYRGGREGNPKRLGEAASLAFPTRSNFLTIRDTYSTVTKVFKVLAPSGAAIRSATRPPRRPAGKSLVSANLQPDTKL